MLHEEVKTDREVCKDGPVGRKRTSVEACSRSDSWIKGRGGSTSGIGCEHLLVWSGDGQGKFKIPGIDQPKQQTVHASGDEECWVICNRRGGSESWYEVGVGDSGTNAKTGVELKMLRWE